VLIPYQRGDLVALMHEHGVVEHEEHTEHGTHLQGRLPVELAGRFAHFWARAEAQ
jgi:GTP-binding protein HflX